MDHPFLFRIPIPPLFNFSECLWYLDRGYDDCSYRLHENEIQKAIEIEGQVFLVSIRDKSESLEVEILSGPSTEDAGPFLVNYIKDWFDLNRDLRPFYALLKADKVLSYMARTFNGLRLVGIVDLFEALCWGIIGQQINLTFAYKLKRRLVERFGTHLKHDQILYFLFPKPEVLAAVSVEELKAMQFSIQKANYLIALANAFANNELSKHILLLEPSFQDRQKKLTDRKGIGIWTANYVLMKCLRDTNSIPYGDAGLLNALLKHHIIEDRKDMVKMEAFFERYKGWESYIVFYLWRSLAMKK